MSYAFFIGSSLVVFWLIAPKFWEVAGTYELSFQFSLAPSVLAISLALAPHTSHLMKPSLPHYLIISKTNILCHEFHKSVKLLGYPCCCSSSHFSHNFDRKKRPKTFLVMKLYTRVIRKHKRPLSIGQVQSLTAVTVKIPKQP